jgi:hypothetical protein
MRLAPLVVCAFAVTAAAAPRAHAAKWKDLKIAEDAFGGNNHMPTAGTDDGTTAWTLSSNGDDQFVMSSTDGVHWTRIADAPGGANGIVHAGKTLVLVGSGGDDGSPLWRVDGDKTVKIAAPWGDAGIIALVSDGKAFFAATKEQVYTSADGKTWTPYAEKLPDGATGLATGAYGVVVLLDWGAMTLYKEGDEWWKLRDDNLLCAPTKNAWLAEGVSYGRPSGTWSTGGAKHSWVLEAQPLRCRLEGKTLLVETGESSEGVYRAQGDKLVPVAALRRDVHLVAVVHLGKRTLALATEGDDSIVLELVP